MERFTDRLQHAWDAFMSRDPPDYSDLGASSYSPPKRPQLKKGNERSIINSVYNRLAMDAASITLVHARVDSEGMYLNTIDSGLNYCLTTEANLDQSHWAFKQDMYMSLLDEGCIAIVPTETTVDPDLTASFEIKELQVGKIVEWYPKHVKIELYNPNTSRKECVVLPKKIVGIVQNPFYSVMNEPNSIMQRLIRKLNILDAIDEESGAGKLDLLIQLPYTIRSDSRRSQAERRKNDIIDQLNNSKYGIAYIDSTEKVTQLNRPVENNLLKQIEFLTSMLYSQLGTTKEVLDGTANETVMTNYYARNSELLVAAVACEMNRKFLSKTARSQGQSISYFRDPFKLVPVTNMPDIVDKFTRNEVLSSNEVRQIIGRKPVDTQRANELINKNIKQENPDEFEEGTEEETEDDYTEDDYLNQVSRLDDIDRMIDELESDVKRDELKHAYASPYYDPVKAHEYYEAHKQVKSRHSTTGLNEKGREAAKYVRDRLKEVRDTKTEKSKVQTESYIDSANDTKKRNTAAKKKTVDRQIERHTNVMTLKISTLREKLTGLSKEEKKAEIDKEIAKLREANNSEKVQLRNGYKSYREEQTETYRTTRDSLNGQHKVNKQQYRDEYDNGYASELEAIRADPTMVTQKKESTSKNSKKKS